jgi:hypothetical protein
MQEWKLNFKKHIPNLISCQPDAVVDGLLALYNEFRLFGIGKQETRFACSVPVLRLRLEAVGRISKNAG